MSTLQTTDAVSNNPELSVTELSGALKRTLEDRFGFVRVRGEISNFRGVQASGHAYFSLKDANARIDGVIWKGVYARLRTKPQEGLEVIASGKITTFAGKSSYQIVIETLEPAGIGALMALLDERRRRLAAQGLFDEARKQLIPFLPRVIGVVTSPTGSVIRDILHRIADRFPRHVLVWPVRVQGEASAAEVAGAIAGFNALPIDGPIPRPDVLIIARGGGSLEDLWSFNEESVVQAAAQSAIPLVSAIGHETDWTLLDLVADLRAPTPTGAAEKAVPVRAELMGIVADMARRLLNAPSRQLVRSRGDLRALARALPSGEEVLAQPRQRLDRAGERLASGHAGALVRQRLALAKLGASLARQSPQARMARIGQHLESLGQRLSRGRDVLHGRQRDFASQLGQRLKSALDARLRLGQQDIKARRARLGVLSLRMAPAWQRVQERRSLRLGALEQMRLTLGYKSTLERGFALVRDAQGHPVRHASSLADSTRVTLEFADGQRPAIIGVNDSPRPVAKPAPKAGQQSLF